MILTTGKSSLENRHTNIALANSTGINSSLTILNGIFFDDMFVCVIVSWGVYLMIG